MKKTLLLLAFGSIGMAVHAQEKVNSVIFNQAGTESVVNQLRFTPQQKQTVLNYTRQASNHGSYANKTTATHTDRWYNYGDYFDAYLTDEGNSAALSGVLLWNDTLGEALYTSGLGHNRMVSVGSILMPWADGFNNPVYYNDEMMLDTLHGYTVDTLRIYGSHNINPAKTGVVDTLTITTEHGANIFKVRYTGMTSRYGVDTLRCADMRYDSVTNTGTYTAGSPVSTIKIPLTASMWGDTLTNGTFVLTVPVNIVCAANEMAGMTLSFKTGDASFPTTLPGDTIEAFNDVYEYNSFYPLSMFKQVGTNVAFAPYFPEDYNEGVYKTLPSFNNGYATQYVPMWAWSTNSGASGSYLQHIYLDWHLKCTGCGTVGVNDMAVNTISAQGYPNPAGNQLNVSFAQVSGTATVTLSNTLGQVVATQQVSNGKATFNTANLPSGIYLYTINAAEGYNTGRVSIAH